VTTPLDDIVREAILPALAMLPAKMDTPQARVMLLAIGMQESRFEHRLQQGGPARGFWQFEKGGGVKGVMTHAQCDQYAQGVCSARGVPFERTAIYLALAKDDVLAAALARLLLWSDPRPLPARTDPQGGWDLYARVWRPGKPHRETWDAFYNRAVKQVYGGTHQ
jgi:hypothetical protein